MRYLKKFESILKPHNIDNRLDLIRGQILKTVSVEVLQGDLIIDNELYLDVESKIREIRGNVRIKIDKIPLWLKSVKLIGDFDCYRCNLTSLNGSPYWVGGNFWASENDLENLVGAPNFIGGDFLCGWNNITSLEGAPKKVEGRFWINNNPGNFNVGDIVNKSNPGGNIWVENSKTLK